MTLAPREFWRLVVEDKELVFVRRRRHDDCVFEPALHALGYAAGPVEVGAILDRPDIEALQPTVREHGIRQVIGVRVLSGHQRTAALREGPGPHRLEVRFAGRRGASPVSDCRWPAWAWT